MTELITRPSAWLLQQAAALPDTFVMKTVAAERGWFEIATGVASGVLTLTILGLAVVLGPAAWSFWRSFRKVRELLDRVYADVTPLTRHASSISIYRPCHELHPEHRRRPAAGVAAQGL